MFKAITLYECSPDSVIVNVLQRGGRSTEVNLLRVQADKCCNFH